jgi:hypothetical protein
VTTGDLTQAAGLLAALLTLVAAVLVIALHAVGTDVDPGEDGVSAYALTRFGAWYRAQVVATGAAALLLAFALVAGGFEPGGGAVLLVVFAASRILITRYPTDPRGTTQFSRAGRLHILLAATTFVSIAVAAPWVAWTLSANADWHGPANGLVMLGWLTAILAIGTFATTTTPSTRRIFGLVERGAYAAWILWILVMALSVSGRI